MATLAQSRMKRIASIFKVLKLGSEEAQDSDLEEDLYTIARVLANMMIMAAEKRRRCMYYSDKGYCMFLGLEAPIHGIEMIFDENARRWRVVVSKHPEICAVCPFWEFKR